VTEPPSPYGSSPRGITSRDVELAADALLRAGERPTIERIRDKIGRGSPNTINPILDAWWKRLAARLDAGPAALHRLPESVAHVAEALWMQALAEARRRAEQELTKDARTAAQTKSDLEVRSHVLTLREGELDTRLKSRERVQATLEAQLEALTLLLRKEQAARDAQARRVAALEEQLSVRPGTPAGRKRKQPARRAVEFRSKKKSAPKRIDRAEHRRRTR
jgi:plasmid replication DNA-binding protein KfrA